MFACNEWRRKEKRREKKQTRVKFKGKIQRKFLVYHLLIRI